MRDYHFPGRSAVFSSNGLCATSHPLAAKTSIDILQKGGNAMDAAIAGALILGFCEPQMAGIGGDCFILFSPAGTHDIKAMNGSGKAPMGLVADTLRDKGHTTVPKQSVEAVTVPGAIDAFCQLSEDWGILGLDKLLAPAIHYAKEGIPVAPRVSYDWQKAIHKLNPSALNKFSRSGKAPNVGDIFTAIGQAEVLNQIAQLGRDGFYRGAVAEDMVSSLNALGGTHTMEDFSEQRAFYTNPVSGSYKYANLVEHPPNGQGATAILMLNILSEFDLSKFPPFGAERAHLEAEVTKVAYHTRNRIIADPDHTHALEEMLSLQTAKKLANTIDLKRVLPSPNMLCEAQHTDTVYITVVDKDRMAVSLIYSIFDSFGSGIASKRYGILFHNRGAGFNLIRDHANELKPRTRPMHTIIPAMLRNKEQVFLPFGVMGGQYQPVGHARIISNIIDYNLSLQEAIDAPRSFCDEGLMKVERSYEPHVVQQLEDIGHNVSQNMEAIGGAQAIYIHESGVLEGASDPRKDGCALGY